MKTTTDEILDLLNDDMVSHGLLAQCVEQIDDCDVPLETRLKSTLADLLSSGKVEIGSAHLARPDYVEFVAWQGSIDERMLRAIEAIRVTSDADKEFAYWLCLREKVDRFETVESISAEKSSPA